MPKIRFMYEGNDYDLNREKTITKIIESVSQQIQLPNELVIFIADLGEAVYGNTSLDYRFKNRITVNKNLQESGIIEVLVHELIHVNQVHTGQLSVTRTGSYVWRGRNYKVQNYETSDHRQYAQLPWEKDVVKKQHIILTETLKYLAEKSE